MRTVVLKAIALLSAVSIACLSPLGQPQQVQRSDTQEVKTPELPQGLTQARIRAHVMAPTHVKNIRMDEDDPDREVRYKLRVVDKKFKTTPRPDLGALGLAINKILKDSVTGYILQVRQNGKLVHTGVWNWAQTPTDQGKGWNEDTRMHVASVSKFLTAVGLVKVLDKQGISYNAKVIDYLPTYWKKGPNIVPLMLAGMLHPMPAWSQTARPPARPQVLDWEKMTEQQFKELPDSQPVLLEGKRVTLRDVRAKVRARQEQMARRDSTARARLVQTKTSSEVQSSIEVIRRKQEQAEAAEMSNMEVELKRFRQKRPAGVAALQQKAPSKVGQMPGGTSTTTPQVPKITKVLGVIQPGGPVLIGGENFGGAPGRVRMIVQGSWELLLENLEWYSSGVGGKIPNNPALVQGAQARFVVETSSGATSNQWAVNWVMEIKELPPADVKVVTCSDAGKRNRCNGKGGIAGLPCGQGLIANAQSPPGSKSISGLHNNCWGAVGDDSGVDVYEIKLANGWVLHEAVFGWSASEDGEGYVVDPGVVPAGSTSWKPKISWSVTPADEIAYWAYVFIRGPKGVPHQ